MIVGIYVRVSTQEQAKEGYSIAEQEERIRKYCSSFDWKIAKVFSDPGFSGGNMKRPALQDLISCVENHEIEKVVVYKLDRLSRSQLDTLYLIEKVFLANKVDFVSISENFDTSSPFGKAMIGILAVFAQLEREQIKERMAMGREGRAKSGKFHGSGTIPIGYKYQDGELVVDEYEGMQVKEVFSLFLNGYSIRKIETILNQKGYSHKHGTWIRETVRYVLQNPVYIGMVKFADKTYPGIHEPLISENDFYTAQQILTQNKGKLHERQGSGYCTLLGGKLHCKQCGALYSRKFGPSKKHQYYVCYSRSKLSRSMIKNPDCKNKNWKVSELDEIILSEILKLSFEPLKPPDKPRKAGKSTEILSAELSRLKGQISRLMDLYALGTISLEQIKEKTEPLSEQVERLESTLENLQHTEERENLIENQIRTASEVIKEGTFEQKRLIIDSLIEYIELDGEDISIHWNF